jgi:hypothetical protein
MNTDKVRSSTGEVISSGDEKLRMVFYETRGGNDGVNIRNPIYNFAVSTTSPLFGSWVKMEREGGFLWVNKNSVMKRLTEGPHGTVSKADVEQAFHTGKLSELIKLVPVDFVPADVAARALLASSPLPSQQMSPSPLPAIDPLPRSSFTSSLPAQPITSSTPPAIDLLPRRPSTSSLPSDSPGVAPSSSSSTESVQQTILSPLEQIESFLNSIRELLVARSSSPSIQAYQSQYLEKVDEKLELIRKDLQADTEEPYEGYNNQDGIEQMVAMIHEEVLSEIGETRQRND